jgi:hypothetical protein
VQQHDPLGATTRGQLLDLALHYASVFRLPPEVMYDGWEVLQRLLMAGATPPLGASGGKMWRLMLVACLLIAARQSGAEALPAGLPSYDAVSLNTGYSAESILNTEQNVHLVLGSDAAAVSALRVAQVLLERLAGGHQEPRQAGLLAEDLAASMYRVACSSGLFRVQPSLVAQALLYCVRKKRGLVPLWPAALVALTGIYDPSVGDLGLVLGQLAPLLDLDGSGGAGGADAAPPATAAAKQDATSAAPAAAAAAATTVVATAATGAATSSGHNNNNNNAGGAAGAGIPAPAAGAPGGGRAGVSSEGDKAAAAGTGSSVPTAAPAESNNKAAVGASVAAGTSDASSAGAQAAASPAAPAERDAAGTPAGGASVVTVVSTPDVPAPV